MRRRPRIGAVSVILLVLGVLLSGCTDDSPTPEAGSSAGTSSSESTSSNTGDPSSAAPTPSDPGDPGSAAPPHLAGDSTPLAPGTYQFSFLANPGVETPDALVDVPGGFNDGTNPGERGGWYVVSHDGDAFLGLWTVGKVQRDACLRPRHDYLTPGPSVKDLANALVAQKSTRAPAPEPVTLAGYQGLYVELASPTNISRCDLTPGLWGDPGGRGIYYDGQVDLVWILDVEGQRLVVDASHGPTSTASERDKLTSMVESLEFAPAT